MAPKKSAANVSSASTPAPQSSTPSTPSVPSTTASQSSRSTTKSVGSSSSSSNASSLGDTQQVFIDIWNKYIDDTPQRAKLTDAFLVFLMLVGAIQFAYCLLAGNYPFNAFLSGFSATVGQFVLTASFRIQTNPANEKEFAAISHERAFADFVFGSMILHFFCVNFIN